MSGIRCRSCARLQFANDPVDDNPIVCLRCAEGMRDVWSAGLRSDVAALRAENERLTEALREIANEGCAQVRYERDGTGTRTYRCPDRWPHHDGGAKWCWGCIARAALAAEEGK